MACRFSEILAAHVIYEPTLNLLKLFKHLVWHLVLKYKVANYDQPISLVGQRSLSDRFIWLHFRYKIHPDRLGGGGGRCLGGHFFMNSKMLVKYAVICKTSGIFHQCFCPTPLAKMEDFRMLNFVTAQLIIRI